MINSGDDDAESMAIDSMKKVGRRFKRGNTDGETAMAKDPRISESKGKYDGNDAIQRVRIVQMS